MANIGISLRPLTIAHANFCSSVMKAGNRVFALYQIDVALNPFWVVEMDPATMMHRPVGPAQRFASHAGALRVLAALATSALGED